MRRYTIYLILVAIMLFVFVACGNNEQASVPQDDDINPFAQLAQPLQNFFEGGDEGYDTKAIIIDIDSQGTQGVLAVRHIAQPELTGHGHPVPAARVFYIHGRTYYIDIHTFQDEPPVFITEDGRFVEFAGSWSRHWFVLYEIDSRTGRLLPYIHIYTEHADYDIYGENPSHSLYRRTWDDGIHMPEPITQEEFDELMAQYGLANMTSWRDMPDETDHILPQE